MTKTRNKILSLPIGIALIILGLGTLFRTMHWPYGKVLYLGSIIAVGTFYIFRFIFKNEQNAKDYVKLLLVLSWVFTCLIIPSRLIDPFYSRTIFQLLGLTWFILEIIDRTKPERKPQRTHNVIFIGILLGVVQFIFVTFRWPSLISINVLPYILIGIGFIIDSKKS